MAVISILTILVINLVLSKIVYSSVDGSYMEEFESTLEANSGTWSVLIGMLVSILFIIVSNFTKIKDKVKDGLKTSAIDSLTPLVNSCAVVGFGSVVKVLPIFAVVSGAVLGLSTLPLLSEVVSVNLPCAMTASASGGLSDYNAELIQNQIAERLYTSRSKISRMLKEARELRIVEIYIQEPWERNLEYE